MSNPETSALKIQLFGPLDARLNGAPLPGLRHREGERLLAYLALQNGAAVSYRTLAERFWPAEARQNADGHSDFPSTRQAVHNLRRALGEEACRLQSLGKGIVRLDLADAEVDVLAFDAAIAQSERQKEGDKRQKEEGSDLHPSSFIPHPLEVAVALYRGPLLEGWTDPWALDARARRRREHTRVLGRLVERARARRDYAEAEEWLDRALEAEPLEECWWRARMEVMALRGRQEAIGTRYKELGALLHRHGREPEKETEALAARLRDEAIQTPNSKLPPRYEPVGGAVPLDSPFYIVRPVDEAFREAIAHRDSIVLVKGVREVGKTSLLARGLQQAREAGARWALTDFQSLDEEHLASAEALFLALANAIALQIDLPVRPHSVWNPDLGGNMNMEWFLRHHVLDAFPEPLVWGLDEVDRLFAYPFGGAVFGLFRSWHNRRSLDPDGPWSRLTLAIAYATEAHLFITDLNQSPFNVGTRLTLEDFTLGQVEELNRRYGEPLGNAKELARFYSLVGGQPSLVRRGLYEMATRELDIAELEAQADHDEGPFGDHLRHLLVSLSRNAERTEAMRGVLRGGGCPTADSFYHLRSAGLLRGDSAAAVQPRCQLYASYLARHLL